VFLVYTHKLNNFFFLKKKTFNRKEHKPSSLLARQKERKACATDNIVVKEKYLNLYSQSIALSEDGRMKTTF